MKRSIAEERPAILAYDESAFAQRLCYDQLDVATACEVFRLNRQMTADVLRRLPDAAFARVGVHNERGPLTVAEFVAIYVDHLDHHLGFLRRKRELLGKPLQD